MSFISLIQHSLFIAYIAARTEFIYTYFKTNYNDTSLKDHPFKRQYMYGTDCVLGNFSVMQPHIQRPPLSMTSNHAWCLPNPL
jgi:hypothetical protein